VEDVMAVDALQKDVVRLYGQAGSAQIFASRLISFPFTELDAMLNGESQTDIEGTLARATWIVISMTDVNGDGLSILRRFFTERPNLIRDNKVILFSFTAPYYLDATDISKLTAYYALYSKQPAFVDVAARLLFQQVSLQGASPVSIPDVGYDLLVETAPDPSQVIPLALDGENVTPVGTGTATAEATQLPSYRIGDTIAVRAGPILDRNGHVVPDGTVAQFTLSTRGDTGGILRQVDANTLEGIARATFVIDKPGIVEVSVTSEPAQHSQVLQFNASNEGVAVTIATPVLTPSPSPVAPTPTPTVIENPWATPSGYPRIGGWFLVMLAIFGSVGLVYSAMSRLVSAHWGLRWALCILIGGLIGYNYLALGLPGATDLVLEGPGASGMLLLTFLGETFGGITALIWMQVLASQSRKKAEQKQ
jgi:beta-N-acetylhexosaminidase